MTLVGVHGMEFSCLAETARVWAHGKHVYLKSRPALSVMAERCPRSDIHREEKIEPALAGSNVRK